jgi:hypothetical protein
MLALRAVLLIPLAALALLLQGCGSGGGPAQESEEVAKASAEASISQPEADAPAEASISEPGADAPTVIYPPADIVERVGSVEALWGSAKSLVTMAEAHNTVMIGRVVAVEVGYPLSGFILSHFGESGGETPPPGHPKAASSVTPDPSGKIGPVGSWYTVEVIQVLRGDGIRAGDTITITQWGGVADGVIHENEDDPLIRVPATYLFFLVGFELALGAPLPAGVIATSLGLQSFDWYLVNPLLNLILRR